MGGANGGGAKSRVTGGTGVPRAGVIVLCAVDAVDARRIPSGGVASLSTNATGVLRGAIAVVAGAARGGADASGVTGLNALGRAGAVTREIGSMTGVCGGCTSGNGVVS